MNYYVMKDGKYFAMDYWGRWRFQEDKKTNTNTQWSSHPTTAMTFNTYDAAKGVAKEYGGTPVEIK